MWYFEKGVKPNLDFIEDIKNENKLREKLSEIIKLIDSRSIQLDLESLIVNETYITNLSKNIKEILLRQLIK